MFETTSTTTSDLSSVSLIPSFLFVLAVLILIISSFWNIFTKAGKPGWAAIVPFYNIYILLKIIGRPGWWLVFYLLAFIPFIGLIVAIVISIITALDIAKSFGKSSTFGIVGLFLFGIVGFPMLAFGDAKYQGPANKPEEGNAPLE
jgi:hypothetical protein